MKDRADNVDYLVDAIGTIAGGGSVIGDEVIDTLEGIVPVRRIGVSTRHGKRDGRRMWTGAQTLPESIAAV